MGLDWPNRFDRTPPGQRENTTKFKVSFSRTKRELRQEMERLGVDMWGMDDETGSGGDPGVVVRWTKDNVDYAVACDAYTSKKDNLREAYLWIKETRMRSDRPVETGQDDFAAAQLPPGDPEREMVVGRQPPHEILGVAPDADPDAAEAAAKRLQRKYHPDTGEEPNREKFQRVTKARKRLVEQ